MFSQIVNPKTGRKVSINSRLGKKILNNYINQLGGHNGPCAINTSSGRCKKSLVGDSNCEVVNGRCKKKTKTVKKSTKAAKKQKVTKKVKKDKDIENLEMRFKKLQKKTVQVEQIDRDPEKAHVFMMNIEFTPTPGSNMPPTGPQIFAVNPGQDPKSKAWSGDYCYEPHWEDNGEAIPDDAECYRGRFEWKEKQKTYSSGQAHCNGRIINCLDEEVIHERQRKWYANRDKEHKKHFNKEVSAELKKMILQGAKEGDLVENLAQSGYRTAGVFILKKDLKGELQMVSLDTEMDDYGHVGDGFFLGPEYPVGYWNKAEFEKAYWHSYPTIEPVHKDILLDLKLGDFDIMGKYSVAFFEWGALKFDGEPVEVLRKIKKIPFYNDRAYFEEQNTGVAEITDGQWGDWVFEQ